MCQDTGDYITIVGPRRSMLELIEAQTRFDVFRRFELSAPRLIDFSQNELPGSERFRLDESPSIAVIWQKSDPPSSAIRVAAEMQAELAVGVPELNVRPLPELMCEPGYEFEVVQGGNVSQANVHPASQTHIIHTKSMIQSTSQAAGHRVALLDTGHANSSHTMVDCLGNSMTSVSAADQHGHGSAVAQVIDFVNQSADVYPIRVLGANGRGKSSEVLAGLNYALWSNQFDAVNASLSTVLTGPCDTSFGRSINYMYSLCRSAPGCAVPLVVAAAGNKQGRKSAYPASLPGALVAMALVFDPSSNSYQQAGYNSSPAPGSTILDAYGGDTLNPAVSVTNSAGATRDVWGTSIATAIVTGACLP